MGAAQRGPSGRHHPAAVGTPRRGALAAGPGTACLPCQSARMALVAQARPQCAELLPDVAQRIAGLLEDEDRQARMAGKRRRHPLRPASAAAATAATGAALAARCHLQQCSAAAAALNSAVCMSYAHIRPPLPCCHGCRAAMLSTCAAWCAAIQAVPELWPEAELTGPNLDVDELPWFGHTEQPEQHLVADAERAAELAEGAAALDALTWRVRITGCKRQVGSARPHAAYAQLPQIFSLIVPTVLCSRPGCTPWWRRCLPPCASCGWKWIAEGRSAT